MWVGEGGSGLEGFNLHALMHETRRSPGVGSMLVHRQRRWTSIEPTRDRRFTFSGIWGQIMTQGPPVFVIEISRYIIIIWVYCLIKMNVCVTVTYKTVLRKPASRGWSSTIVTPRSLYIVLGKTDTNSPSDQVSSGDIQWLNLNNHLRWVSFYSLSQIVIRTGFEVGFVMIQISHISLKIQIRRPKYGILPPKLSNNWMTVVIGRSRHVTGWATIRLVRGRILDVVREGLVLVFQVICQIVRESDACITCLKAKYPGPVFINIFLHSFFSVNM